MNDLTALPAYSAEELAGLTPSKLVDLIIEDEDRTPRNVIDECAQRGEAMVEHLRQLHEDDYLWQLDDDSDDDGVWWLRLHAAMILGLIPDERAGLLLVEFMRRMSEEDDGNLQGWLSGYWPALFRNKPDSVLPALRELGEDDGMDWYIRVNAVEPALDFAARQGGESLDRALAWVAAMAANEEEDWDFRVAASNKLLDYPRDEHRPLLESLAARQSGWDMYYSVEDIQQAYSGTPSGSRRDHFDNPWAFYEPEAIADRQARWRKEDAREERQRLERENIRRDDWHSKPYVRPEPYIRPEPKTGRNDPCPCGSGKKYKKCCLSRE